MSLMVHISPFEPSSIAMLPWLGAFRPLIEPFTQFGKSKDYLIAVAQKLRDARRKENGSTNKVCMY